MSTLFTVKQGAQLPAIQLTLTSSADFDLDDADSCDFLYRVPGAEEVESVELQIVDAAARTVLLDLPPEAVDAVGRFECHVKIVFSGKTMYIPQVGFDTFLVGETFEP